jgi:ribosomal silencing factor RsfS
MFLVWKRQVRAGSAVFFSSKTSGDDGESLTEWIPPDRPLAGDKGQSHLYRRKDEEVEIEEELTIDQLPKEEDGDKIYHHNGKEYVVEEELSIDQLLELDDDEKELMERLEAALQAQEEKAKELKKKAALSSTKAVEEPVDWLQTRRTKQPFEMVKPGEGRAKRQEEADLPVIPHTLLTKAEIDTLLSSLGGQDFNLILDRSKEKRMGGALGMIWVTATSPQHLRLLADMLVRQLKRRGLAEMGVIGAKFGSEGAESEDDDWRVVDCYNYIVHIQLEETRRLLDLESLWSGEDDMLKVNFLDEDSVDDYVASHPVPEGYGRGPLVVSDLSATLSALKKKRFSTPAPTRKRTSFRGKKRRG